MLIGEAKGTNQSDALILRCGEAVADYDGASHERVNSRLEYVRSSSPGSRARRLRKLNSSHRLDFKRTRQNMNTVSVQEYGARIFSRKRTKNSDSCSARVVTLKFADFAYKNAFPAKTETKT